MDKVKSAFEDLLTRLQTDYIDLGMIHYVDSVEEFHNIMNGEFIQYVHELKQKGIIHHVGMSTHNPATAKLAVLSGEIEMLLFSINPAFDLLPSNENIIDDMFADQYAENLDGMVNKLYDLASMQTEVPASIKGHYQELKVNASACVACKSCESRCPFEVKIADRMKKAKELLG